MKERPMLMRADAYTFAVLRCCRHTHRDRNATAFTDNANSLYSRVCEKDAYAYVRVQDKRI